MWNLRKEPTKVVIVVESDWNVRENIVRALIDAGFIVLEAENGDEAITFLRSRPAVDAIYTDVRLRGTGTGWDVAEAYRAANSDMPIIYTSGRSSDPLRMVDGSLFFSKPYIEDDVVRACRDLISFAEKSDRARTK